MGVRYWITSIGKIFLFSVLAGIYVGYSHNEIKAWGDLIKAFNDSIIPAIGIIIGWILMRSPLAKIKEDIKEDK